MKYIVNKEHKRDYPDPIKLTKGDVVLVGERHVGPEGWEHELGWLSSNVLEIKAGIS